MHFIIIILLLALFLIIVDFSQDCEKLEKLVLGKYFYINNVNIKINVIVKKVASEFNHSYVALYIIQAISESFLQSFDLIFSYIGF